MFRSIDKFDPARAKFTTWVYTFVRNHCFDVLKKRRIKTTSMHAAECDEADRDFADERELQPTEGLQNSELGRRIGEALGTLLRGLTQVHASHVAARAALAESLADSEMGTPGSSARALPSPPRTAPRSVLAIGAGPCAMAGAFKGRIAAIATVSIIRIASSPPSCRSIPETACFHGFGSWIGRKASPGEGGGVPGRYAPAI